MVARVVRYAWRHRRREYRLGTRVDADQPRSQTGGYTPPHSAAEWGDNHGQVTLRVCRLVVRISADIWLSFLTAMSRSSLTLRVRRVISSADCDPVCRCVCCLLSARREVVTFLHARFSFPSPGTRSFLCEPIASCHVAKMLFSVREHLASHWPDLAEGRLRLDRLNRNGVGETFFPWACHPARKSARGPRFAHSSRGKKVSPTPSSAALRPKRVRRQSPSAFRSPSRPRWSRARRQLGEVRWRTSVLSRSPAASSRARSSP